MKTRWHMLLMAGALAFGGLSFVSCEKSSSSKENSTEAATSYQCPMDCEDGKTYTEAQACPVCGMDIKPVSSK